MMDIQHDTDEETHGVTSYAIGYYSGGNNYFHQELHRSVRVTEDPWTFTSYMYYGFRAIKTDFTVAYYDAYFVSAINYPQYFYITNVRQVLTYTECDFLNLDTLEPDNRQIWADVTYSGTPI
ncbi:MAG: hypothetical protein NUK63_07650 [Candidatus Bathyarchaeum tardum]|nr:MAG: hypothetical protein NUK63_07650 [Candidatus Bathyarchaeum tardum]